MALTVEPAIRDSAASRALRVVMSGLHEHWSAARLAAAVGVSRRSLYRAVRREFGLSPGSLFRQARLAQARQALHTLGAERSVTRIALDCGFTHLGRFSLAYRKEFGELPSQTLRRAVAAASHSPPEDRSDARIALLTRRIE